MTDVSDDEPAYSVDTSLFDALVGEGFVAHIIKCADPSVTYRMI